MRLQSIRGMKDVLPGEAEVWQFIEQTTRRLCSLYGYAEIRPPILEATEVFARGIGVATDIVEKEMYTFEDRDGARLALRPEATASVVRAYLEHHLGQDGAPTKLYYFGPMFRHERPQAGRFRQFYQLGIEAINADDPSLDVEVLALLTDLVRALGIERWDLELNSLGCPTCRPPYQQVLIEALTARRASLCGDCRRRTATNPLRVLDCKREACRTATADVPTPLNHLCATCRTHFHAVLAGLDALKLPYRIQPRLVRGLDYYTRTAFEAVVEGLGAQNAIVAGGRYDGLIEALGGPPTPGIGFAAGLERLASVTDRRRLPAQPPLLFIAALGDEARRQRLQLLHQFRLEGIRVETAYGDTSLKSQMRRADKTGAGYCVIIGEQELASRSAILRDMRTKAQQELSLADLVPTLTRLLLSGQAIRGDQES